MVTVALASGSYRRCVKAVSVLRLCLCHQRNFCKGSSLSFALVFLHLALSFRVACKYVMSTCLWQLKNSMAQHRDLLPSTEVDEPTPQTTAPGHVSHKVSQACLVFN